MLWQVLLKLFASWITWIMRSRDDSCLVDFAVTGCDLALLLLILFEQLLNACLCIFRAMQAFLKMVLRAYGGQL